MKNIQIYTTENCPFCIKAKDKLKDNYLDFFEYDISKNENEMRRELAQKFDIEGGMATVPQIVINGKHIGGYTDLKEIVDSGRLNQYLR